MSPLDRMWHEGEGQPTVELIDYNGNTVGSFNLDVPIAAGYANIAVMMANGHKPERTTVPYADGTERDITHGYRYYAHLYYSTASKAGRALCTAIVNHLGAHEKNVVKFWPHRDATTNWHLCKLDEDPDIDAIIEYRGIGYSLTLSLKSARREYVLPAAVAACISDFNDVALAYNPGDHVKNFGSVAAGYNPTDQPAYFSPCPSKGEPDLPDYD